MPEEDRPGVTKLKLASERRAVVYWCPCARCGYDLKGLSVEGSCPECGLRIEVSLTPGAERWRYDVEQMRRIAGGLGVMMVGAGVGLVAGVCAWIPDFAELVAPLVALAAVLWMGGVWWATSARGQDARAVGDRARRLSRMSVAGLMGLLGAGALIWFSLPGFFGFGGFLVFTHLLVALAALGTIVCLCAPMAFAYEVAKALPSRAATAACAVAAIVGVLTLTLGRTPGHLGAPVGLSLFCLASLAGLGLLQLKIRSWLRWLNAAGPSGAAAG